MATVRLTCLFVLLAFPGLRAQSPPSQLLTVDFAAIDKHGNLVSDLTAADFRVTDGGDRREIVYFRRGQDRTPPLTSLTREYSNRSFGTFPHATVVLLDQLNARVELSGPEWEQIGQTLEHAEWDRYAYFYVLQKDRALYPVNGLPESWLDAAPFETVRIREILPLFLDMRREYHAQPIETDTPRRDRLGPRTESTGLRAQRETQVALQELATRLATVPGPKSIVWIGPNFKGSSVPQSLVDPTPHIREIGGLTFDPIPIYRVIVQTLNSYGTIGRPGNAEVAKTLGLAMTDLQRGYRLGYEAPPGNWDGRLHDIHITCTHPEVTIRGGAAYTAVRPVDIEDDRRQTVPDLIAVSPFDASTIRFRAIALPDSAAPRFELHIDAHDVVFRRVGNQFQCDLAAQAIRYREDNDYEVLEDVVLASLKLTPEAHDAALRDGISVRLTATAASAANRFRLVVYDRATKSFGTLTVPAPHAPR